MEEINVIGVAGNIYLLVNKNHVNTAGCKAVTVLHNNIDPKDTIKTFEDINIPLKFNAFQDIIEVQESEDIKTMLHQKLSDEDEKTIIEFLK